jgi:hypothetical protein
VKTVSLEANNPILKALVEMVSDDVVIITSGNKPICAVIQVDEEDLQTWRLGENPEFLAIMQRSWERLQREGGVSLPEARQRLLAE